MKHDRSQRTDIVFKCSQVFSSWTLYSWQFLSLLCMFLLTHLLKSGLLSQLFACTCLQLKSWSYLDAIHIISVMSPPFFFLWWIQHLGTAAHWQPYCLRHKSSQSSIVKVSHIRWWYVKFLISARLILNLHLSCLRNWYFHHGGPKA